MIIGQEEDGIEILVKAGKVYSSHQICEAI
jgi:hypothetical protein